MKNKLINILEKNICKVKETPETLVEAFEAVRVISINEEATNLIETLKKLDRHFENDADFLLSVLQDELKRLNQESEIPEMRIVRSTQKSFIEYVAKVFTLYVKGE